MSSKFKRIKKVYAYTDKKTLFVYVLLRMLIK